MAPASPAVLAQRISPLTTQNTDMSLWGTVTSVGRGLLSGGIAGGITGLLGSGGTSITRATPTSPTGFGGGPFNLPTPPVYGPGGVALPGFGGSTPTQCPKGYHLNKHPLAPTKHHGALPAHSMCVRNRKMQALNSRAITRSLRRIKRASKIVRKLHAFSGPRRLSAGPAPRGGHRPGCGCVVCRRR